LNAWLASCSYKYLPFCLEKTNNLFNLIYEMSPWNINLLNPICPEKYIPCQRDKY
jgi:hypothetical protein